MTSEARTQRSVIPAEEGIQKKDLDSSSVSFPSMQADMGGLTALGPSDKLLQLCPAWRGSERVSAGRSRGFRPPDTGESEKATMGLDGDRSLGSAMIMNVSPNRMELLGLRRRLAVARRGHKLLKDKLDALIQEFIAVVREVQELRRSVESRLELAYGKALRASGSMAPEALDAALSAPASVLDIRVKEINLMSVRMARLQSERTGSLFPYGFEGTAAELDAAVLNFNDLLPDLIRLAELEKTVERLADEIEEDPAARVNALEHVSHPKP